MSNATKVTINSPFLVTPEDARVLASGWSVKKHLIGLDIYNEQGENVGSVSDVIVGGSNNLMFAIVGVGGFLGMGKHEVALPVRSFRIAEGALLLPGATADTLKNLPEFVYPSESWFNYDFSGNTSEVVYTDTVYADDPSNHLNRDPITGEPGAHPVGTGLGAAGGAATGAAVGAVGGPVGLAVGAVVGAVVGGLAGKGAAEAVNPTEEEAYWRDSYLSEPYYSRSYTYDDYAPAYRAGYQSRMEGRASWDEARAESQRRWEAENASSRLQWAEAEPAVKAAWERANRRYVQETGY